MAIDRVYGLYRSGTKADEPPMSSELTTILVGCSSVLGLTGGAIGSSVGMLISTRAGVSMISEDPQQSRNVILLAALPMTQTLYGTIFAIYVATTVMPRAATLSMVAAGGIVGLGLAVMAAELFSAWCQGITCATGISMLSKTKGRITTPTLVLAAYTEFIGILGMVFGIALTSLMTG